MMEPETSQQIFSFFNFLSFEAKVSMNSEVETKEENLNFFQFN